MRRKRLVEDLITGLLGVGMVSGMIGGIGIFIVLIILLVTAVDAFVLMKMWNWYIPIITDQFNKLTYPASIALLLILRLIFGTFRNDKTEVNIPSQKNESEGTSKQQEPKTKKKEFNLTPYINIFITPLFILLIGYIIQLWFI